MRVCGKDYIKVPGSFGDPTRDVVFSVIGFTSDGTRINFDTDVPTGTYNGVGPNGPNTVRRCGAICEGQAQGYAYAYEAVYNEYVTPFNPNGTGSATVTVDQAYRYRGNNVSIPFYAYVRPDNLSSHITLNYGMAPANWTVYVQGNPLSLSPVLNTQDLPANTSLMDPYNQTIPWGAPYRMIAKNTSKWRGHTSQMGLQNQLFGQHCSYNIFHFINLINNNSSNQGPPLECLGQGFSLQEGEWGQYDGDCLPIETGNSAVTFEGQNSIFDILESLADCDGYGGTDNHNWWETADVSIEEVFVKTGSGQPPVGTTADQHIKWRYTFSGGTTGSTVLNPGIYKMNVVTRSAQYFPLIFEVVERTPISTSQSDMIVPTFYPVPIENNSFNIKLETGFSGQLTYELRDHNGSLLYTERIDVTKTENGAFHTIPVEVPGGIEGGLLFNRFICPDGSVHTQTTIK